MSTIPYRAQQDWDPAAEQDTVTLPGRPRRRLGGPGSALLLAVLLGVIGFYVGVRVEKSQLASSPSPSTALSGAARAATGTGGTRAGGFAALTGRGGLAGGNATFGTVANISHGALYVNSPSGSTVKVTVSSATKITKSQTVGKSAVHPGDTVVVQGVKGNNGTVAAASVNDTGAAGAGLGGGLGAGSSGAGGASSSGAGGASSSTGGSAAVNSLFGSSSGASK